MIKVGGYICVAKVDFSPTYPAEEILFGKGVHNGDKPYENLRSNGLVPYGTLDEVEEGVRGLYERDEFDGVSVARLRMSIVDEVRELRKLRKSKSIVVIRLGRQGEPWNSPVVDWPLLGPVVRGRRDLGTIPGAYLTQNGLVAFNSLDDALELGREVNRQGDSGIWLADFHLKIIGGKR